MFDLAMVASALPAAKNSKRMYAIFTPPKFTKASFQQQLSIPDNLPLPAARPTL
jgi:hypothetical protein